MTPEQQHLLTNHSLSPSSNQHVLLEFDCFHPVVYIQKFYEIEPSLHKKQVMVANCYNWLTSNMFRPYSAITRLTTDGVHHLL